MTAKTRTQDVVECRMLCRGYIEVSITTVGNGDAIRHSFEVRPGETPSVTGYGRETANTVRAVVKAYREQWAAMSPERRAMRLLQEHDREHARRVQDSIQEARLYDPEDPYSMEAAISAVERSAEERTRMVDLLTNVFNVSARDLSVKGLA